MDQALLSILDNVSETKYRTARRLRNVPLYPKLHTIWTQTDRHPYSPCTSKYTLSGHRQTDTHTVPQSKHYLDTDRQTPSPYLKLYIAPCVATAWSLELEQCLTIFILDGEPRVEECKVLLDVADGGPRRRLDFHLL